MLRAARRCASASLLCRCLPALTSTLRMCPLFCVHGILLYLFCVVHGFVFLFLALTVFSFSSARLLLAQSLRPRPY